MTGASVTPEATDRPAGRGAPLGWAAVALGSAVLAAGATGGLSGGMPAVLAATLTRAAMDVAGVACVGTVLLALLAPGHASAAVPVLRGAAAVWLGAGLLDLVFRSALVTGKPVTGVTPPDLVAFVTGPAAGSGLVDGCDGRRARPRLLDRRPVRRRTRARSGVADPGVRPRRARRTRRDRTRRRLR